MKVIVFSCCFYDHRSLYGGILICMKKIGKGNSEAMKFLRIREVRERQIIVDVAKSHKRPILYSLIVDVWEFHQCWNCVYNTGCHHECKVLEASYPIRKFTEERFGINLRELSLVPIRKIKP